MQPHFQLLILCLPYSQVNISIDELVVNVGQQEDRLLLHEQEKEQSMGRDELATRTTSQEPM